MADTSRQNTSWQQAFRPTTRRLVQLYSALLHNAYLKGFISGEIYKGNAKYTCVPGFNCYSCPGAVGACPLGSLQNALASTGHRAGWYVIGILLLFGVTLGRTICGWLCPLGLIQELLHKIPTPKIRKSSITRILSWLKYVILAVFVIAIPLWYGLSQNLPLPAFCKYICPAGTFEGAVGHLANPANASMYSMLGILFTRKWVIMLVIGLACIFCYRSFCRFICPLGAIYGLFNRFNIIGVKVDTERCNHCGACVRHCEMDVKCVGDHECINCGKCMDVCKQEAISIKAGSITLKEPLYVKGSRHKGANHSEKSTRSGSMDADLKQTSRRSRIIWGIALAVLCAALLWFNVLDPSVNRSDHSMKTSDSSTGGKDSALIPAEHESETESGSTEIKTGSETESGYTESGTEPGYVVSETDMGNTSSYETEPETELKAETESESAMESKPATESESAMESKSAMESEKQSADITESMAPVGHEVGNQLADFTLTCYDGSKFHLAETRGKVTIINLWATYCTPCIKELPYFNDLYLEYKDDLAMLIVHPSLVTDDPEEFLADKGYKMPFATDTDEDTLNKIVGGTGTLPQTIVLNKKGEVTYNKIGSVTPQLLEALYHDALSEHD